MGAGAGTGHPPSASRGRAVPRLLEWRSRRRASARSTERGCTRTPKASSIRSGSCAGRSAGIGGQLLLGPGEDLLGELAGAARPGPGGHQPFQPGGLQRGGRGVVGRPGVAERRGGLGDRGSARLDLAHHLVLDLHRVPGVEEVAAQELRVGHLLRVRVQAPCGGQRRLLGVLPALLRRPCRLLIPITVRMILPYACQRKHVPLPACREISQENQAFSSGKIGNAMSPARKGGIIFLTFTA